MAHTEKEYEERVSFEEEAANAGAFLENDDVSAFILLHGADRGYECAIFKQIKAPQSNRMMLAHQATYTDGIPGAETVVEEFGPGEYEWRIISKDASKREELAGKTMVRVPRVFLGPRWDRLHNRFNWKKKAEERKERIEALREEADEARIEQMYGVPIPAAGGLGKSEILEIVTALRGPGATGESPLTVALLSKLMDPRPGINWTAVAQVAAIAIPALSPALAKLFAPRAPATGPYDSIIANIVTQALENKVDALKPPEAPSSLVTELLDFGREVLPEALKFLSRLPATARAPVAAAAINSNLKGKALFEALKTDPEALADVVNKWDAEFNPDDVDLLLESAGLTRPKSTEGNYEKYPPRDEQPAGAAAPAAGAAGAPAAPVVETGSPPPT